MGTYHIKSTAYSPQMVKELLHRRYIRVLDGGSGRERQNVEEMCRTELSKVVYDEGC
ncbi:hypothetical protein BDQ17DRAFT_1373336 [Cyathus striatus]|nr:hypothetical protein BDQ17DRAFT_1373336 [Cyathus striatus]